MSLSNIKVNGNTLTIPNLIISGSLNVDGVDIVPAGRLANNIVSDGTIDVAYNGATDTFTLSAQNLAPIAGTNIDLNQSELSNVLNVYSDQITSKALQIDDGAGNIVNVGVSNAGQLLVSNGNNAPDGIVFDNVNNKPTLQQIGTFTELGGGDVLIQPNTTFNNYLRIGNAVAGSSQLHFMYGDGTEAGENIQVACINGQFIIQIYNKAGRAGNNILTINQNGTMQISDGTNTGNVYDSYFNKLTSSNYTYLDTYVKDATGLGVPTPNITLDIETPNLLEADIFLNSNGTGTGGFWKMKLPMTTTGNIINVNINSIKFGISSAGAEYTGSFMVYFSTMYATSTADVSNANNAIFLKSLSKGFEVKYSDCTDAGTGIQATNFTNGQFYSITNVSNTIDSSSPVQELYMFVVQTDIVSVATSFNWIISDIDLSIQYSESTLTQTAIVPINP